MNCGHIKVAGYTMPMDVLEDQLLANVTPDESPVYSWEERNRREKEMEKFQSYDDFMRNKERSSGSRYAVKNIKETKTVRQ